ncbi:hypothetical protein [Piscinibacterium candidicorallinum]|jgi:hypothetical protein|uniref:Uncharacterized protein n=1 Tax=Piscinibacterium candidicorallinum TaxID=1793872 RepID=A0ABV7H6L3_9BURK
MNLKDLLELGSFLVTVIGLPFAIAVFFIEQRKERDNEDEEAYQLLSDAYNEFLQVVLQNPDLKLRTERRNDELNDEQLERRRIIFEMLISLFERAYIVAWEPEMSANQRRRWASWEDYMREWCRREDFVALLPQLLRGEDPDFAEYIKGIAREELPGWLV